MNTATIKIDMKYGYLQSFINNKIWKVMKLYDHNFDTYSSAANV